MTNGMNENGSSHSSFRDEPEEDEGPANGLSKGSGSEHGSYKDDPEPEFEGDFA
jgi:hypothetical protein